MVSVVTTYSEGELERVVGNSSGVVIIADSNLPKSYVDGVMDVCVKTTKVHLIEIEGGESVKTLDNVDRMYEFFDSVEADRETVLICLGGGTITDMGGFAASTYKRGLGLVLLPTTVLGMVDAAIGGKTGVNRKCKNGVIKNQIGTFYNSLMVGINQTWLASLPPEEIRSGWAEMAKHALLIGGEHLNDFKNVSSDLDGVGRFIKRSAEIKEGIVRRDEKEKGERASLNLGHTVGHALESLSLDKTEDSSARIKHGEAVAWGLVFALEASVIKLGFDKNIASELQQWIVTGIEKRVNMGSSEEVWAKMRGDKKNINGNVRDVLLQAPGEVIWDFEWNREEFTILWEQFREKYA
ncbi:MAG TPA: 3-dehydroquinate synthase [Flavobacteriales bacterium]|nr:3-dehydroquinate synthase [Flavobacteriales bacterium]HIO16711.1 3-dehydroquinate synthase [Flavobacteriales bacterium]HIO60151.1 3-dehydroquinate synthase [Flavobacteriales bacterium]